MKLAIFFLLFKAGLIVGKPNHRSFLFVLKVVYFNFVLSFYYNFSPLVHLPHYNIIIQSVINNVAGNYLDDLSSTVVASAVFENNTEIKILIISWILR
jgi:hypothetical protein